MDREPLTGQYKWDIETGEFHIVASEATETPNLEKQASLLQWAEDIRKLENWKGEKYADREGWRKYYL
jgi:hypothetical protein